MTLITFGKHSGMDYEIILNKDISYCEFIHRCPENDKTKEFKDWLSLNIERGIKNAQDKKLESLRKLHTRV